MIPLISRHQTQSVVLELGHHVITALEKFSLVQSVPDEISPSYYVIVPVIYPWSPRDGGPSSWHRAVATDPTARRPIARSTPRAQADRPIVL